MHPAAQARLLLTFPNALPALRPRSKPAVTAILLPSVGAAEVTLSQPATGRPWTSYNLTFCRPATPTTEATCKTAVPCNATTAPGATTTCSVKGLAVKTDYSLTAVAIKGAVVSPASEPANFTSLDFE